MARVRRKTAVATTRWNYEIAGIAALAFALLGAVALLAPGKTGVVGRALAGSLHAAFGGAAIGFPILIALTGAIIFLEINVPEMIAKLGSAALGYFLIIDAAFAANGGFFGFHLAQLLVKFLGRIGAGLVLVLGAIMITVAITNVSLKKVIGWCVITVQELLAHLPQREKPPSKPAAATRPPANVREAFNLPALLSTSSLARGAQSAAAAATAGVAKVVRAAAPAQPAAKSAAGGFDTGELAGFDSAAGDDEDEDEEAYDEDEGDYEDDEDGDDADDDGEEYDDEEAEDDDEEVEDEEDVEYEDDDEEYDDDEEQGDDEAGENEEEEPAAAIAATEGEYQGPSEAEPRQYRLPDLDLFDPAQAQVGDDNNRASVLIDTLGSFGVGAKVLHVERGPSITRYEVKPERGVKISRISALADDLALALAATSVRIEAPIPGKSAVGIEVPNASVSIVAIREILEAIPMRGNGPALPMALGKDITGRPVFGDLAKMPHLLVSGATGAGKSVCLNSIIASLLVCATPDQVQLLMIDPKRVELTVYNGIPHLIKEVITDARLAAGALFEMTKEMDSRYERFAQAGVRKIEEYNAKFPDEKLPYVVIIIDELADLMLVAPSRVETTISRLAALARATGIHLIVATQRPSVDVITGIIKANIPSRIAFAVSSQVDSRTILDIAGAERLLGRGDMLYLPIDLPKPIRAQGALITAAEVGRLVAFWAEQARPENLLDVDVAPIEDENGNKAVDPLAYDAAKFIIETNYASTAQLQQQFQIGHPRAVRLMKQLEDFKVVGPHEGTKPRKILLSLGDLEVLAPRLRKDDPQQELLTAGR